MTRAVTIVNTSNWAGEDYRVVVRRESFPEWEEEYLLRPGDRCTVCPPEGGTIEYIPEEETSEPYYTTTRGQVFPFVYSGVGDVGKNVSSQE